MVTRGLPDFRSKGHLLTHIETILGFYLPRCTDVTGGFYHCYRDDGSIYAQATRHLVSSTRFVIQFSLCANLFPDKKDELISLARHGISFLREVHRNSSTGGYAWTLDRNTKIQDDRNLTYGLAFVLLAYSHAFLAGIREVEPFIEETTQLLDQHMWEENHGLYADERSSDWKVLNPYRGQNSNMHACEAHIAAFRATNQSKHLTRAKLIAYNLCERQSKICAAATTHKIMYEHYLPDWSSPDLEHNKNNPRDIFQPWGFQPGHMVEWSRLLLELNALDPEDWYIPRAAELFRLAFQFGWDSENEGLIYSFEPNATARQCDQDKYKWVQAEAIATASQLSQFDPANSKFYLGWYDKLWTYSWKVFIDHEMGGWYRILNPQNQKYDDLKSPPGKVDYHVISSCVVCLSAF